MDADRVGLRKRVENVPVLCLLEGCAEEPCVGEGKLSAMERSLRHSRPDGVLKEATCPDGRVGESRGLEVLLNLGFV